MPPEKHPQEVRLTDETIDYLKEIMRDTVKEAVGAGINDALNKETAKQFWTAGLEVLQEQAMKQTGRLVFGGIGGLLKNLFWLAIAIVGVFWIFGWTGVTAFLKSAFAAGSST